jgi:Na+/proline symporter
MVTRYLAGASPNETRAAWWVYMGFVQFTWIAMTIFGMVLRGVLPAIADAESGLSVFFRSATGPALTGIIAADIFATIAAASNSLLVAMSQTLRFDLLRVSRASWVRSAPEWAITTAIGAVTMAVSLALHSSVVSLALSSTSLMAAGLAPVVAVRVLGWRHSGSSLVLSVLVGVGVAALWRAAGFGVLINEAAPGMLAALLTAVASVARSMVSRRLSQVSKEKRDVANNNT